MIDVMHTYVGDFGHWHNILSQLDLNHLMSADFWPMPDDWSLVATKFKETNLSGDFAKWWNNVVKTGQVWAFLLGAIFGYLAKTFTTYG
ncbi:hypothetical protein IQ266_25220 [filamentous cyanobacterium LEGE 11480]|uniref:Uncharacterized protein n=1 Tax=Romeriopsis navalis LEGE 11480 TaxID=2777977 RepID=A0A928VSP7_9CYAN|nr:hypothetical protein [Romeriopsis navalis]MBE9033042.1 hypothetical protein [Romeriopsis navalis LEGE 11480]